MIDYRKVDVQALLDIARCAEGKLPAFHAFDMSLVLYRDAYCGTAGCLLGTWWLVDRNSCRVRPNTAQFWPDIKRRLCIPSYAMNFLFDGHDRGTSARAASLTRQQAIRRLRKFIYYVLHKREIYQDYQKARRTGDVGVAQKVKELVHA